MKSNPNLVFLLAARRTGGTALAKAFKDQGFRLFYDPLNPALANLNEATKLNSEAWHSKHPAGLKYFEEFANIDTSVLPKDLIRANAQHIGKSDPQYEEIRNYFYNLVNSTSEDIKKCFKIEQVGVYELLSSEFPDAVFIGITRNFEDLIESYLNLYLTSLDGSFFQRDLDYYLANGNAHSEADATPSPESYIDAVEFVSRTHSALVRDFCQIQIAIDSNSASVETPAGFEPDEEIMQIINSFVKQVPAVKFGFESEMIIKNVGSIVSERDALVSERDALVSERDALVLSRSRRVIAFFRRSMGFR